jgi:methionine sulfoxide reductase heme-binding subunit
MTTQRRRAARIVLTLVASGAVGVVMIGLSQHYAPLRTWEVVRALGWLASACLVGALAVTPLQRVLRSPLLPALRRSLGLAAASCGAVHATAALLGLPGLAAGVLSDAWLRAGVAAFLLLLALFITSFDAPLRRLRLQHWKELHRLIYPAALCVALHALLGPYGTPALELTLAVCVALLLALRICLALVSKTSPTE